MRPLDRRASRNPRCAVALLVAGVVLCASSPPASARTPDQRAVAKRLIAGVKKARTPKAGYRALLGVMRELDIAVVTTAGRPLVATPEPGYARRFQLYDFELRALAAQLRRRQTATLADVATMLTRSGLSLAPKTAFPAELLSESVAETARDALRRPRSERSLLPLLVRELGLARGYDIARGMPGAKTPLDALQAWLVAADVTLPVLRLVPAGSAPRAGARAQASSATDECARYNEAAEKLQEKLGKDAEAKQWVVDKAVGAIGDKVGDKLKRQGTRWAIRNLPRWAVRATYRTGQALAAGVVDGLHGSLLAFSVDVRALHTSLGPTHWLHATGESNDLTFEVQVIMRDDLGKTAAKCGKAAGYDIPEKGPVPGVWVGWEQVDEALDPAQGRLECPTKLAGLCASQTGADGVARVVFKPRKESLPGVGTERDKTGVLNGIAAYQGLGGNVLGTIAQFVSPKYAGTRWFVLSHNPRGYKISYRSPRICGTFGNNGSCVEYEFVWEYELRVCGSEAYGVPWTGKQTYTAYHASSGEQTDHYEEPVEVVFQPGQTTTWHEQYDQGEPDRRTDFTILESDRSTMRVDLYRTNAFKRGDEAFSEYRDTQEVRIEEDLSCPPLPE